MANGWDDRDVGGRVAGVLAAGGTLTAVLSLVLAGAAGEPYLSADGVNPWIVVFAAGLLAGLVAMPFGLELRLRTRYPDRDKRWELSLVAWGGVAIAVLALAFAAGFDTGTLLGAAGLIAAIEAGMVVATVGLWLLSGG